MCIFLVPAVAFQTDIIVSLVKSHLLRVTNLIFSPSHGQTDKQTDGIHIGLTPVEQKKHVQDIMRRIPKGKYLSWILLPIFSGSPDPIFQMPCLDQYF